MKLFALNNVSSRYKLLYGHPELSLRDPSGELTLNRIINTLVQKLNSTNLIMSRKNSVEFKILLPFPLAITVFLFLMSACSTDNGDEENRFEDGVSIEVRELLGEETLNIIENDLGIPIHRGDNPPDIEAMLAQKVQKSFSSADGAVVEMIPLHFLKSNISNDGLEPGRRFNDLYLRFSNQDMDDYTVDFATIHPGGNPYIGKNSLIIGNGNSFSIFGPTESESEGETILSVEIFSGTVTDEGISSPYSGFIMVDNGGLSSLVDNGTGRSFEDGNGHAELSTWPGASKDVPTKSIYKARRGSVGSN